MILAHFLMSILPVPAIGASETIDSHSFSVNFSPHVVNECFKLQLMYKKRKNNYTLLQLGRKEGHKKGLHKGIFLDTYWSSLQVPSPSSYWAKALRMTDSSSVPVGSRRISVRMKVEEWQTLGCWPKVKFRAGQVAWIHLAHTEDASSHTRGRGWVWRWSCRWLHRSLDELIEQEQVGSE